MSTRTLVTGVGGFAGQYLAAHLASMDDAVFGVARRAVEWHLPGAEQSTSLLLGDLTSVADVRRVVETSRPDRIYHLASRSSVAESFRDPAGVLHNNVDGLVNLMEATREFAPGARVLVVSSSEIYGRAKSSAPIDEDDALRPENPYAVSKAAQDLIGYQYWIANGLGVVRVRPFNHFGPGQSRAFVASSFAYQIAAIEAGKQEAVLRVGNLDAQRDFTDVRDMVRAYRLALESGEPGGAYNLGRGVPTSIRELLEHLRARSRVAVDVEIDPDRLRPVDAPTQLCDNRRFRERTGWEPALPIATSLDDMLEYWRTWLSGGQNPSPDPGGS